MSYSLYDKRANGVKSLVPFSEVMQTYEAKCMHFLLYMQIINLN